jgi:hypothetical protein
MMYQRQWLTALELTGSELPAFQLTAPSLAAFQPTAPSLTAFQLTASPAARPTSHLLDFLQHDAPFLSAFSSSSLVLSDPGAGALAGHAPLVAVPIR